MAGILFTNGNTFLAGYKSYKGHITGIGGKSHGDETLIQTAIRETLEELLGITEISAFFIKLFERTLVPFKKIENSGYTHFMCDFDELTAFLAIAEIAFTFSPYYDAFPRTLQDLILKRKNTERAEITHLTLLPYVKDLRIARHLIEDINHVVTPVSMT